MPRPASIVLPHLALDAGLDSGLDAGAVAHFGRFRLVRSRRLLLDGEEPVPLGSRAMELLLLLVEKAGQTLSREELEARVWPRTLVEETSLRVQMSALRKALRDGQGGVRYITNLPGRGYCFVVPVTLHPDAASRREPESGLGSPSATRAHSELPTRLTRIVGRHDVTAALRTQLATRRLVSIVGTGGIGKTTVALALAAAAEREGVHADGVRFVHLAPLSDPRMVTGAVALAVGFPIAAQPTVSSLCTFLSRRRMLIVMDNCEHVIDAVASLTESILKASPGVQVLATSREALYAEGESVRQLGPLRAPTASDRLTAGQALEFPAIQLFVERAAAGAGGFQLSEETLPAVRQLCHQLDGIPLAIELAAARVASLGVLGLAKRLDSLFGLLTRGRRTALSRHQTLEALLDWSYDLLTPTEQRVLARLSVFRSSFTLEAAGIVVGDKEIPSAQVIDTVPSLAAKSLLSLDATSSAARYRLLYMTRDYAERKLVHGEDDSAVRMRHARHLGTTCDLLRAGFGAQSEQERASNFVRMIDDIRSALTWAYSPAGDETLAVQLTAAVRVRIFSLGMGEDDRKWIELGLGRAIRLSPPQPLLELRLRMAWCFLSGHTDGMTPHQPEMFEHNLALTERPEAAPLRIEALYSMCVGCLGQGRYRDLLGMARRLREQAVGDDEPLGLLIGGRMQVFANHYLGRHEVALDLVRPVIDQPAAARHHWCVSVPNAVSVGLVEARILWMLGDPARAQSTIDRVLTLADRAHPFGMSQALAMAAIPMALWNGDTDRAQALVDQLEEQAHRGAPGFWHTWVPTFRRVIQQMNGRPEAEVFAPGSDWRMPMNWAAQDLMGTLSADLITPEAMARVASGAVAWCAPEMLRLRGESLLAQSPSADDAREQAESLFLNALEIARGQRAVAWERRVAASLARLRAHDQRNRPSLLVEQTPHPARQG